jgi:adenylate cyclase
MRNWLSRITGAAGTGGDSYADLPARVREAIRHQQDQSEILIGWIQLAVVIVFGFLYSVSPKTFTMDLRVSMGVGVEPVPWAIGIYLVFTVIRLALAYRRHLPGWLLSLSVVIDLAVLYGLMYSFHLQYDQPASFVLKEPTLLYIFVFIALRALRFEARYVILTGVVAALGWVGMVLYVITDERGNPMITHNYVVYLTSNSVLIGAEVEKIASILTVTAIIALALARARALLVRAVAEGTAARELSRFFAPEVAREITHAAQTVSAGHGVVREAAIVNIDVRGFTRLAADMPADDLIALLHDYQSRLVPIIQRHGGTIDKFLGDGIMATFGAVQPSDRYAADALAAIDAVMAAVDAWTAERASRGLPALRVGAAVATGRIVFGAVGDETRLEYTVIGDAVNLSAKLEKHTKAEGVRALASIDAYKLALAQGHVPPDACEVRHACRVAGVTDPLDLVVLAA